MLAVVRRRRRNLGIFDPTELEATTGSQINCGWLSGGLFKGECWALAFPAFVSPATEAAARAVANPDVVYPGMPAPAPPRAVTEYGVSPTVPPTVDEAQRAVNAAVDQAIASTQAANLDYFSQVAAGLDTSGGGAGGLGLGSWLLIGAAAVVGVVIVARR